MTGSIPKSEATKELNPKREPREPRALSTEYHRARKQLMLWAGILFIWELVGIDLEKAKESGGNIGTIVGAIKSPQAIPWTLLILDAYFLFKLTIEWHQCSPGRRILRVSRIDFGSAWAVSLIAVALYIAQTASHFQLADLLGSFSLWKALLVMAGSVCGGALGRVLSDLLMGSTLMYKWSSLIIMFAILMIIALAAKYFGYAFRFVLIGILVGLLMSAIMHAVRSLTLRFSKRKVSAG